MGELRDTHRMEGTSQGDLISKLCSQLATVEGNLVSQAADLLAAEQLRADLTKAQTQAKEEEEKRTKAISLLKTVRMKLVKAEKDRAEERAERSRAGEETERVKAEREREVAGAKERFEKDLGARKAAWELEMITTKVRLLFRMGVQADVPLSFRLLMRRRCLEESQRSTDWRRS